MTLAPPPPASAAAPSSAPSAGSLDDLAALTRPDFPLLGQIACLGQPLIYLDHAATSQKPQPVLDALQQYYGHDNANVHRGAHQLSARATDHFEAARAAVAGFVGAASAREIVFTRNASEAINLVARTWGEANLRAGDEVLLTVMEHHSNLVPWQLLAARTGCVLRHAGLTASGELDLDDWRSKLSDRTRLVSVVHVSNALGCRNPIETLVPLAHAAGALVLVDA
ncbi:MAG: aminotransferase class V-fold PLP-dependent enzyme, partial [Synechococcaceae cyanobacterium]